MALMTRYNSRVWFFAVLITSIGILLYFSLFSRSDLVQMYKAYAARGELSLQMGSLVFGDEHRARIIILGEGRRFRRVITTRKFLGGVGVRVDGKAIMPSKGVVVVLLDETGSIKREVSFDAIQDLLIDTYSIRLPNDKLIERVFKEEIEAETAEEKSDKWFLPG